MAGPIVVTLACIDVVSLALLFVFFLVIARDYHLFRASRQSTQSGPAAHRVVLSKLIAASLSLFVGIICLCCVFADASVCDPLARLASSTWIVCKMAIYWFLFFKSRLVRPLARMTLIEKAVALATCGVPIFVTVAAITNTGVLATPENICSVRVCFHVSVLLWVSCSLCE